MSVLLLLLELAAIAVASIINGLTGFGGAIVFQMLWSIMQSWGVEGAGDLRLGLAITFLIGAVQCVQMGPSILRAGDVRWELLIGMLPGMLFASSLGTALVDVLPQALLKKFLGIIFFGFAIWQIGLKFRALRMERKAKEEAFLLEVQQNEEKRRTRQQQAEVQTTDTPASTASFLGGDSSPSSARPALSHLLDAELPTAECVWPLDAEHAPEETYSDSMDALSVGQRSRKSSEANINNNSPRDVYVELVQVESAAETYAPASPSGLEVAASSTAPPAAAAAASVSPSPPALLPRPTVLTPRGLWDWLYPWLFQRVFYGALLTGFASGFLGGLFGTGGPPIMAFFSFIPITKGEVRGTSIWLGVVMLLPRTITLFAFGIFRWNDWLVYLLLPAATILGATVGMKLHERVNVNALLLVLQFLVLLSTVSLTNAMDGSPFGNFMLVLYMIVCIVTASVVVYLSSMHYRFLRERPQLVPQWEEKERAEQEAARVATEAAAGGVVIDHPLVVHADGSTSGGYSSWHA